MPSYLKSTGVARTRFGGVGFTQKRLDGLFRKGYIDGAFNSWPGKWILPAAPATVCYFDDMDAQGYALFTYTVGFYMGSVDSALPGDAPDSSDVTIHSSIARVSVFTS